MWRDRYDQTQNHTFEHFGITGLQAYVGEWANLPYLLRSMQQELPDVCFAFFFTSEAMEASSPYELIALFPVLTTPIDNESKEILSILPLRFILL